jgi:hypothetical protein
MLISYFVSYFTPLSPLSLFRLVDMDPAVNLCTRCGAAARTAVDSLGTLLEPDTATSVLL